MRELTAIRGDLRRSQALALAASLFTTLFLAWIAASAAGINPLFLPGPGEVWVAAIHLYGDRGFAADIATSIARVLVGFAAAAGVAVPLGLLMGTFPAARAMFEPCVSFIRCMPATAFIPLLVLWVGIGDAQKYSVIFVGTFLLADRVVVLSAHPGRVKEIVPIELPHPRSIDQTEEPRFVQLRHQLRRLIFSMERSAANESISVPAG